MSDFNLPEGWVNTILDLVCEKIQDGNYGGDYPKSDEWTIDGVPFITGAALGKTGLLTEKLKYISEEKHAALLKAQVTKGDVIFPNRGATDDQREGRSPFAYLLGSSYVSANINPQITLLRSNGSVNPLFLKHVICSPDFLIQFRELTKGSALAFINLTKTKGIEIPLPPLAEQQQIAKKLDELLAQVDTLKTRLDAIPNILKRFRQSVLAAAVSGRLTEEWRGNDDKYSHDLMQEWGWPEIPKDWIVETYENVVESRLGKMLDKAKNAGIATAYLGNINVRWDSFDLNDLQEILVSEEEQVELGLRLGDVFICEGGEPGRCAIWKGQINRPVIFQKALHRARVTEKLLPEWLVFNLKNDASSLRLEQLFTGTTIKHLTGKALKKYPMRIPPLEEQTEIVRRVEQLFAYADQIEQRVKDAQARVNHLTQSILAKAFRGELTADWRAQNPELISGENSAAALLERIKAEREVVVKPKRKGK